MTAPVSRRTSLKVLAAWASGPWALSCAGDHDGTAASLGGWVLGADAGGGVRAVVDASPPCARPVPIDPENWVAVPVASLPDLDVRGAAMLDDAPSLVHVWLLDDGRGCYRAVWRICSHGACELAYAPATGDLVCPCHGSRFARDGAVQSGPATVPLRVLEARRVGDTIYVRKPLVSSR